MPHWYGHGDRVPLSVAMMTVELCWLGENPAEATNCITHGSRAGNTSLKTNSLMNIAANSPISALFSTLTDHLMTVVDIIHHESVRDYVYIIQRNLTYTFSLVGFTWGDPHFQTVDGLTYTFNGYGEYILLESEENDLGVQVRLALLNSTFNATVISAVAVVQGGIQPVQVEESEGDVIVYVNGSAIELSAEDDQNKIVTEDTTYNSFDEFVASEQNFSMAEYISLRFSDDDLIITTSTGASVMVSSSSSVLHLAVEVNDDFVNATAGLLGYFNANDSDDFYTPHGEILPSNSSERDLFSYGKLCEFPSM